MGFKRGESGNPAGRPKGAKNKTGIILREAVADFLQNNFGQIQKDFQALEPKDRIKVYTDLLQYGLPKLQSVSSNIEFEQLTDEQLNEIIERLMRG